MVHYYSTLLWYIIHVNARLFNISNSITSVVGAVTYYLDNCGCNVDFMSGAAEQRDFFSVFITECKGMQPPEK